MSEDNNVVDMVEAAQKKGKFSLADAIKNRAYPEKSVDVYVDARSAYELEELNKELQGLTQNSDQDLIAEMEAKAEVLKGNILSSKLTFHMKGVGQSVVEAANKKAEELFPAKESEQNEDWIPYYLCSLVASNIVKVTDSEGNDDLTEYTTDDVLEIRGAIPVDSWAVIVDTMQKLTLASSYFDGAVDAGFLPKS